MSDDQVRVPGQEEESEGAAFAVTFPQLAADSVPQDEEYCLVRLEGQTRRIRFHDYHEIYAIPGLYERIFYEKLACQSPALLGKLLDAINAMLDAVHAPIQEAAQVLDQLAQRDLRARIAGTPVHDAEQPDGTAPDDTLVPASEIMPRPEIAAGLGIREGAARVHYHHAVKRLMAWIA